MAETAAAMRRTLARWDSMKANFAIAYDGLMERVAAEVASEQQAASDVVANAAGLMRVVHNDGRSQWCWDTTLAADTANAMQGLTIKADVADHDAVWPHEGEEEQAEARDGRAAPVEPLTDATEAAPAVSADAHEAALAEAEELLRSGRPAEAQQLVLRLLTEHHTNQRVRRMLARSLDAPDGPSLLANQLPRSRAAAPTLAYLAAVARDHGRVDASLRLSERALELDATSASTARLAMQAHELLHDHAGAMSFLRRYCTTNASRRVRALTCEQVAAALPTAELLAGAGLHIAGAGAVAGAGGVPLRAALPLPPKATEGTSGETSGVEIAAPASDSSAPAPLAADELETLGLWFAGVKLLFCMGALSLLPPLLAIVEPVVTSAPDELHVTAIAIDFAFYCMVVHLLPSLLQLPTRPPPSRLPLLYVLGDSNVLPPAWRVVRWRGAAHLLHPLLVTGLKVWHLRPGCDNYTTAHFESLVRQLRDGASVIVCLGSIDCNHLHRPEGGREELPAEVEEEADNSHPAGTALGELGAAEPTRAPRIGYTATPNGVSASIRTDEAAYADILQQLAESPPADFWAAVAQRELHWLHLPRRAWLSRPSSGAAQWAGWHADTADRAQLDLETPWAPWQRCCDDSELPFVRWFLGGQTNAAFNEVDRHVLQARGEATAFLSDAGEGIPCERTSVGMLAAESALVASCLIHDAFYLSSGQPRIALFLPNDYRATVWIEAAKRAAVPYVAVASGTASYALADRVADTSAVVLVTSDGLVPAAQQALDLMAIPPAAVVVPPCPTKAGNGWQVATDALQRARERLLRASDGEPVSSLAPTPLIRALWRLASPTPVDASHPLFILYTSGSTGKPKGIVHAHGGYEVGLCLTTRVVFDLQSARDTLLVLATPGWISGQSYMIAAALLCHAPSVLLQGSPVSPPERFAATIERHHASATGLQTGSGHLPCWCVH